MRADVEYAHDRAEQVKGHLTVRLKSDSDGQYDVNVASINPETVCNGARDAIVFHDALHFAMNTHDFYTYY